MIQSLFILKFNMIKILESSYFNLLSFLIDLKYFNKITIIVIFEIKTKF